MLHDSAVSHRVRDDLQAHVPEAEHRQLSGREGAGVPEVPRQAGADARRERPREVRRLRTLRRGLSGRRDLPRGGGERRHASRPVRATRRSTRFTRRAASSAATAKRPARSRRSSWARTTSSPSTATRTSSGTSKTCSSRRRRRRPRPLARPDRPPMEGFLDALDQRVLVCDGAMGTMLYARGIFLNRCFDELNLTAARPRRRCPPRVRPRRRRRHRDEHVRRQSLQARATSASRTDARDQRRGRADRAPRRARRAWVAGSIGPLGVRIEPWGRTGVDEAEQAFASRRPRSPRAASICSSSRRFAT